MRLGRIGCRSTCNGYEYSEFRSHLPEFVSILVIYIIIWKHESLNSRYVKSSLKQLLDKLEHLALIFAIFTVSLFLFNNTFLAYIIITQKAIKPEKELPKAQQTRGHILYLSILVHHQPPHFFCPIKSTQ